MNDIPSWASKYIGIPYKTKGTNIKEGLDCLSIIELIYKEQKNIKLPFNEHLETEENLLNVGKAVSLEKQKWKKVNKPKIFDVVVINIFGYPVHLGLVISKDYMIHSLKGHNSAKERFTGVKWRCRVEGFYQYEA